jgi:peptide/nickel transport system permease protein
MLHAIMPVGTLAIVQVGGFLITMRNNMINLLGEDYITMAKAKGLSNRRVIFNYGARNAILPSVTALSMALGFVIGGSLITEVIFNYPGLGLTLYQGILARDYPLIQGQLLIMTITMLSFNFLADMLYVFLDPRLRTGGK